MTTSEAIIYMQAGADPNIDRFTKEGGVFRTTFVPVPEPSEASQAAAGLVDDGAERVELCGALGPETTAKVIDAIDNRVPVGVCTFGVESVTTAAAFHARIQQGASVMVALIFLQDGADPVADRAVTETGGVRMIFVPVPDESAATKVATELVDNEGADLIELYRGIESVATAKVIEAVGGRVPVGSVRYGR